jgi:hypothetical protein
MTTETLDLVKQSQESFKAALEKLSNAERQLHIADAPPDESAFRSAALYVVEAYRTLLNNSGPYDEFSL